MNITPKLSLIDQLPNDNIMHKLQLRGADGSAGQPFDPGPEVQVKASYLLGVPLADPMPAHVQVTSVSTPVIREITADIERGEQRFQVLENRVHTPAKHIGQHGVGGVVNGALQPTLV